MNTFHPLSSLISPEFAFNMALRAGFLSDNKDARNYAGNFMFMGITNENNPRVQFKHIALRSYVLIPLELLD